MIISEKKLKAPPMVVDCLKYVQRRVFHDQSEVLPRLKAYEVLAIGKGKCGEASAALTSLLDSCGVESRIIKMVRHVVVEAKWDGRWHLLDADLYKHSVIPARSDGTIPSVREVQGNYFMDRFPPTMYVYTREYAAYSRRPVELLRVPRFYEPHEAGFISYYYQMNSGLPLEHPPSRPTGLTAKVASRRVGLEWYVSEDLDGDLLGYEVMISKRPRGWSYIDPAYEFVPRDTSKTVEFTEYPRFEAKLEKGRYCWSVRAIDEHRRKEPLTYYFPSNECEFTVPQQ